MSCEVMGDLKPPMLGKQRPKESSNLLNTSLNSEDGQRPVNRIIIRSNNADGGDNNRNGFFNDDEELKYGAKHVVSIFCPVSICMLIVVITVLSTPYYQRTEQYLVYTPFTDQKVDNSTRLWQSFANALIFITVVVIMSFLLILLYKKRYYKVINGWLILSSLSLLFLITITHVEQIFNALNQPVDILTIALSIWNFGIVGMVAIHWKGPMIVQQSYLLFISSLMALTFIKYIPEWTVWTLLFSVSIWDLIAVLCPKGPLRILVETAQERNEQLFPSLVYSSGMAYTIVNTANQSDNQARGENQLIDFENESTTVQSSTQNNQTENNSNSELQSSNNIPQPSPSRLLINDQNTSTQIVPDATYSSNSANNSSTPLAYDSNSMDDQGVKLGLGDFVFYSILVGKVSTYGDWNTTLACFVAILIGLCLTLLLLAIIKTALPALPISIAFGLIFYFSTSFVVQPFTNELALHQIFI